MDLTIECMQQLDDRISTLEQNLYDLACSVERTLDTLVKRGHGHT